MSWDNVCHAGFRARGSAAERRGGAGRALGPGGQHVRVPRRGPGGGAPGRRLRGPVRAAGLWPPVGPGDADGRGDDAAGAARLLRPGDRRGGPGRRAVEGGDRRGAGRSRVRPVHPGVLAQADREVGPAAPGQRRGPVGDRADRGPEGPAGPPGAERIGAVCTGHDYSGPGKPKIDWDDPQARDALVSALVRDANALVEAFAGEELDEQAASAAALLALVAGQDVEPAEGSDGTDGRWRIARKVAADRVISTVDPDARHTRKSPEARRDGYRA